MEGNFYLDRFLHRFGNHHIIKNGQKEAPLFNRYKTPLHLAIVENNLNQIDYLLGLPNTDLNFHETVTPLQLSIELRCNESLIMRLIDAGCDPNIPSVIYNDTPLHFAITLQTINVACALIKKGARVNVLDNTLETPLFVAIMHDKLEAVSMLLYYGAVATPKELEFVLKIGVDTVEYQLLHNYGDSAFLSVSAAMPKLTYQMYPFIFEILQKGAEFNNVSVIYDSLVCNNSVLFKTAFTVINRFALYEGTTLIDLLRYFLNNCDFENDEWVDCLHMFFGLEFFPTICLDTNIFYNFIQAFLSRSILPVDRLALLYAFLRFNVNISRDSLELVYEKYGFRNELEAILYCGHVGNLQLVTLVHPLLLFIFMNREEELASIQFIVHMEEVVSLLNFFSISATVKKELLSLSLSKMAPSSVIKSLRYKLENTPEFPSLVELARRQARVFIKKTYLIKKSYQFYDSVRELQLPRIVKDIICFKRHLY